MVSAPVSATASESRNAAAALKVAEPATVAEAKSSALLKTVPVAVASIASAPVGVMSNQRPASGSNHAPAESAVSSVPVMAPPANV